MSDCPFCPDNWYNLDIVERINHLCAVVRPLNPVTEGHVLVIHPVHTEHFAKSEYVAADLADAAAAESEATLAAADGSTGGEDVEEL